MAALRGFIEVEKAKLQQATEDAERFEDELNDIERDLWGVRIHFRVQTISRLPTLTHKIKPYLNFSSYFLFPFNLILTLHVAFESSSVTEPFYRSGVTGPR